MLIKLSRLILFWRRASRDLGIKIDVPYRLVLPSGEEIDAILRVPQFGARNGMLVFSDYRQVEGYVDALRDEGYGFSILNEPGKQEVYDISGFIELLDDWGWNGSNEDCPAWIGRV